MKYILLIFLIIFYSKIYSQNETSNWFFGNKAGLNFLTEKPEPLLNSEMNTYEGCSSVSDSLGNLLFYTNGVTVWNKYHQIMQNGTNLFGDTSSTQSALIVKQPGSEFIFFIFTTDDIIYSPDGNITNGLCYSVVDLSLNNGTGAVTSQKNIVLCDSVSEKLSAVVSADKSFVRIVAHEWNNNNFVSWKISSSGLETSPVTVSVGTAHVQIEPDFVLNGIGQMKISSDGTKLALAMLRASLVELFDFDAESGNITNHFKLYFDLQAVYGIEFSPDATKLYITAERKLFQIDLSSGDSAQIAASLTEIYSSDKFMASLQTAPDQKIYVANVESEYLSTIDFPDSLAYKCSYNHNSVFLDNKISRRGLPGFVQSNFVKSDITYVNNCYNDTTFFFISDSVGIDSVLWNFGEPQSGVLNISTQVNPYHIYLRPGSYFVKVYVWKSSVEFTFSRNIIILNLPEIFLNSDTVFCSVDSAKIGLNAHHSEVLWNNNLVSDSIWVKAAGEYSVKVKNIYSGCENTDTLAVDFGINPEINLGNDTVLCQNSAIVLSISDTTLQCFWSNGSADSFIEVTDSGFYDVEVKNSKNCKAFDTIYIEKIYAPEFDLGNDTTICEDTILRLSVNSNNWEILWNDGTTENYIDIFEKGVYGVSAQNICGIFTDSVSVNTTYCGEIFIPNIFTPGDDNINDIFYIKGIETGNWELTVFSRWGEKVFYSKKYLNDWTAEDLGSGVYFYVLKNYETQTELNGTVRVVK